MLALNDSLLRRSRLPGIARADSSISALELAILFACGFGAVAMSALVDLNVRVPGHAILRAVLPISLGLALVPRRGAGLVMGSAAALGLGGMLLMGQRGLGTGATTSLIALGPMFDLAVRRARPGWRLYAAFGAAGLAANLLAFVVRGGAKAGGGIAAGSRALGNWLSVAPYSYAICGLVAGIVCGCIWFGARDRDAGSPGGTET
jgi:hypothetical protein